MRRIGYAAAAEKQKKLVKASVKLQSFSIITTFVILWFSYNMGFACSAVLGGLCALIPNLAAIGWHFRHVSVQTPNKMLASIYLAEALKFILIILLLAGVYSLVAAGSWLKATGVLTGFLVTYLSTLFMSLVAR